MRMKLALALLLSLSACGDDVTCGPGTEASGNTCVPMCEDNQVWDTATTACVDVATFCAEGSTWSATAAACVDDDDLLVADVTESAEPNDPAVDGTATALTLPAVGASTVIGGNVATPADLDDDGYNDPDFDVFEFTTTGPVLLRVSADGVGGASSGFIIFSDDADGDDYADYARGGIGTSTDGAARDLYLPRAGTYQLVAGDAQNIMTYYVYEGSTWVGGGEMGYFITIEQLAVPTATALTFTSGEASASATWAAAPTGTTTSVGFYSVSQATNTIYNYALASTGDASPDLVGFSGTDPVVSGSGGMVVNQTASTVDLVVDFVLTFGVDFTYDLTVSEDAINIVSAASTTTINQPAFDEYYGESIPFSYYGISATAGDIVALDVEGSSGWVYAKITSADLQTSYAGLNPDAETAQYVVRFRAPSTGLYLVSILGTETLSCNMLTGCSGDAETFDLTLAVNKGVPTAVTALPFSGGGALSEAAWEQYFTYTPTAGQALTIDPGAHDVALYDSSFKRISEASGADLLTVAGTTPTAIYIAAGDFTVSATPGTLSLGVSTLTIGNLGNVTTTTPIGISQSGSYFSFTAATPGTATLVVSPPGGVDITVNVLNSTFGVSRTIDLGGNGASETASFLVTSTATPTYFQVTGGTGPFNFTVSLVAFSSESEPNNSVVTADLVGGGFITAALTAGDIDYFRVTVAATALVTINTEANGSPAAGDTQLTLFLADGTTQLAYDDDSGDGYYSKVTSYLPAGDYIVKVNGYSATTAGGYALRVTP